MLTGRADLFRLLGDEDRLRLLALCAEEELTVGELATLLGESQPQITKKSQPLREVGLLAARRDGTRTLLRSSIASPMDVGRGALPEGGRKDIASPTDVGRGAVPEGTRRLLDVDPVMAAALEEGRSLCTKDGSLAKVAAVVASREELSRRFFDATDHEPAPTESDLRAWLPIIASLLPGHALAIDVGTGEGTLLPLLSPLYDRVVAIDRSPARLARCAARIASWGLPNVRLREGDVDDASLVEEIASRGGADLVVMARVLHFSARPKDAIAAATRLVRPSGHLVVVDHLPHDDESLREQGHVWLGFEPHKLRGYLEAAHLDVLAVDAIPSRLDPLPLQLAVARKAPARTN